MASLSFEKPASRRQKKGTRTKGTPLIGDPATPENSTPDDTSRLCDVIYYVTLLALVIVILILLIILCFSGGGSQEMVLEPYECDDGNPCTKDFIKQGACMSFPAHCASGSDQSESTKKDGIKKRYCDVLPCHDKCYEDPIGYIEKKDDVPKDKKNGEDTNGQCGIGVDQGTCVPTTPCKGTCSPSNKKRNGCPDCPHLEFRDVFQDGPHCHCSQYGQCEYEARLFFEFVPVFSFEKGPDLCLNKQLQIDKCMSALDNDYHQSCIQAQPVCEFRETDKKRDVAEREYPAVDITLRCLYTFSCSKAVLALNPVLPLE